MRRIPTLSASLISSLNSYIPDAFTIDNTDSDSIDINVDGDKTFIPIIEEDAADNNDPAISLSSSSSGGAVSIPVMFWLYLLLGTCRQHKLKWTMSFQAFFMQSKPILSIAIILVLFGTCFPVFAQMSMDAQQYTIDENTSINTLVGQVIATEGEASSSIQIDVGTQELSNWSTRGEDYESVSFNTAFDSAPIVFRQLQSSGNYNVNYSVSTYSYTGSMTKKGYEVLFRTRQDNTTATGFDAILETDLWVGGSSSLTSIDSVKGSENLGWLAISESATGSWNELAFEVDQTDSVITQADTTIGFNGPFYEVPQFFSNVVTSNDKNQVGVGVDFLKENKVKLYMDEIDDGDHNAEAVSLMMLQGNGSLSDASGKIIGETGTLSFSDTNRDSARTVSLNNQFSNPVVFVRAIGTDDDIYDASFRFLNVGSNSFTGYLHDDYEYRAWTAHGNFDLHYIVLEAGSWQVELSNYTYSIVSGNDSGAFKVDADTGEIYVADSNPLDYESGIKQYDLTLNVNDGINDFTTTVTIHINNVSDSLNSDAQALEGLSSNDWSGWVVDAAGDVNGDGFDDLLIGVPQEDENGSNSGRVYVLFGNSAGKLAEFYDLVDDATNSIIDSNNGFMINGAKSGDKAGFAVAGGGDVNGDGLADILVGAPYADPNSSESGTAYVVFGKADSAVVELADIASDSNGNGFAMHGAYKYDHVGGSAIMGDVDGDGLADLILGEVSAKSSTSGFTWNSDTHSDENMAYIVYGKSSGASVELSVLADSDDDSGFVVKKKNRSVTDPWKFGAKVLPVGDVNSDGLLDFIVNKGFMGSFTGANMLIFGKTGGDSISFSETNAGDNGLIIHAEDGKYGFYFSTSKGSYLNASPDFITSKIGDVNGDGIDDMALLATDDSCCSSIKNPLAYVIFGSIDITDIELSDIASGNGGYVINNDHSLKNFSDTSLILGAIGGAGDVNGDGYDDIIIGDIYADDGNGRIYVIYGQKETDALYLSDIAIGQGGFYSGGNGGDALGVWVSSAGDINGDGISDMLFSAPEADPNGLSAAGTVYVLLGDGEETTVWGTDQADSLSVNSSDHLAAGTGDDMIIADDAYGALYAGPGNDTFVIQNTNFRRIDGGTGTDILQFDGAGIILDLAARASWVRSIEVFDIDGSGSNTLSFNKSITGSDTVIIRGGSDDLVYSANQQWSNDGTTTTMDGIEYELYTSGNAQLWLKVGLSILINNDPSIENKTFEVTEYSLGGSVLGTLTADANDVGDSIRFEIIAGNDAGNFSIDADSGKLSIADSVARLDYEEAAQYLLTVQVTDSFSATGNATITVNVKNVGVHEHVMSLDVSGDASIWGDHVVNDLLSTSMQETGTAGTSFSQDLGGIDVSTGGILDINLEGEMSFDPSIELAGGWVKADLPMTLSVSYPDEVLAGQNIEISSALNFDDGAGFNVTSPYVGLTVASGLKDFKFSIASSVVDSFNGQTSIKEGMYSKTVESDTGAATSTLCEDVTSDAEKAKCYDENNDIATFRMVANIDMPEWVSEEVYWGSNWDAWYAGAGFEAMQGTKEACKDDYFYPTGEGLFYKLTFNALDTFVSATADLYQEFAIELSPVAVLVLEDGTEYSFDPSENFNFTPESSHDVNNDGMIEATMTVSTNPQFSQTSNFNAGLKLPFKVLEASYNVREAICTATTAYLYGQSGMVFEKGTVGPIINTEFELQIKDLDLGGEISFPLSNQSYSLDMSFDLCADSDAVCAASVDEDLTDTDDDGIPDIRDSDNDNDGFTDNDENDNGTDPYDNSDYPSDIDGDYLSDLNDLDNDNDGTLDVDDAFPLDATGQASEDDVDLDNDGLIEISTLTQLNAMRNDLSGASLSGVTAGCAGNDNGSGCIGYELMNDFDFDENGDGELNDTYNTAAGWTPLGDSSEYFTAKLEGNDFSILNLVINKTVPVQYSGFIGYGENLTIQNLHFSGDLTKVSSVDSYTGGIAGRLMGDNTITNVSFTGIVTSTSNYVGGLVGYAYQLDLLNSTVNASVSGKTYAAGLVGNISQSADIQYSAYTGAVTASNGYAAGIVASADWVEVKYSYVSGSVISEKDYAGGIFSEAYDSGIQNSFVTASVSVANDGNYVGGLVGRSQNIALHNTYVSGAVQGYSSVGGLVGNSEYSLLIENSYATGLLTSHGNLLEGGVVGYVGTTPFDLQDSYWDNESTGQASSANDQGLGYSTLELQAPIDNTGIYVDWLMADWDFGDATQYPALIINGVIYRDNDSDGYWAFEDAFDNDASEHLDSDLDGVGDNSDAFPEDINETQDSDNDGVGDNADAFPEDDTETTDTDNDGIGNNADLDDDNDGLSDEQEVMYGLNSGDANDAYLDNDGDGILNLDEINAGTDLNDDTDFTSVLDADFNSGDDIYYSFNDGSDYDYELHGLTADGEQILVTGYYYDAVNDDDYGHISRINSDASLDTSFSDDGIYYGSTNNLGRYIESVIKINNGGYLAGVSYHDEGSVLSSISNEGVYDDSFFSVQTTPGLFVAKGAQWYEPYVYEAATNELYIGSVDSGMDGSAYLEKVDRDGVADTNFATSGLYTINYSSDMGSEEIKDIFKQSSGNLLVSFRVATELYFTEITTEGVLNTDFATSGYLNPALNGNHHNDVIQLSDGRFAILFDGIYNDVDGLHIVMYSSAGVLDTSFGGSGYFSFSDDLMTFTALNLFEQNNGSFIIASKFKVDDSSLKGTQLVQVDSSGMLDTDFNSVGYNRVAQTGTADVGFSDAVILDNHNIVFAGEDDTSDYKMVLRMMINAYDSDLDGVADDNDAFPNDATETTDSDNDGVGDNSDAFPYESSEDTDTDGDNVGNNEDTDDDGDSYSDIDEIDNGTSTTDDSDVPADNDGDFVSDLNDDDDNDGVIDTEDDSPFDSAVYDLTAPVITLTGSTSISLSLNESYSEAGYSAADNVDGDLSSDVVVSGSVDSSVLGVYTISYDVSDSSGNAAVTVTRQVTVQDEDAPVVIAPNNITVAATDADGTADSDLTISTFLTSANAKDEVDGVITVTNDAPVIFPIGVTTVTFTATDSSDNEGTAQAIVTVTDQTAPIIALTGNTSITLNLNESYSEAGYSATDNVDGDLSSDVVVSGSVDSSVLGVYTISYDVSDSSGNAAVTVTRQVT
ncbi:MAG: DUF5011 domain-containing protein, partial [Alteromonadales bacterium]|nr:DUF5011 domain-containing protein [Alteromonadales bacterium]